MSVAISLPLKLSAIALSTLALTAVASAQQVVKIGQSGPLSGPNAFAGKDNENGTRLAIEELNAKKITVGGQPIKFELVSEDDQCDPKAGMSVAQKFADSGIKYVMGPYCSGVAIPVSRVYSQAGALMSTVGSNPKITQGGYKNLFRIIASDNQIGANMAVYAAKVLRAKTVGVIDDRTAYGQGVAAEFIKAAKGLGLDVVRQEYTTDKSTDFNAILTNMRGKQPDIIFFGGYAPQGAPMLRQMKQLGLKAKLLGGDTLCSPEMGKLAGNAVDGSVFCAQGGAMLESTSQGPAFKAKYKKRFGQDADVYASAFYDQTMLIGEAMAKANSTDPAKVAEVLYKGSYKGVTGTYAYDEAGNMKQAPVTVYSFKNATLTPLSTH